MSVINPANPKKSGGSTPLNTDDTLEVSEENILGVTNPVYGIISQEEFDRLPPEKQNKGLYIIPGTGGGAGLPDNVATITLSKNNDESGEVEGEGVATKGMTVKVKAIPDLANNWMFTHWSEDGEKVSQTNPYQFTVEKDRNLVANFDNTYKFGENWFLDTLYTQGTASTKCVVPSGLLTFLYNPCTETFFLGSASGSYKTCLYEVYWNNEKQRFDALQIIKESTYILSYGNFTFDDDGNLWYISTYSSGGLVKYDINTKDFSIICPYKNLPETSTYTWKYAAYGNGVYFLMDENSNYAYSHDTNEWVIGGKLSTSSSTVTVRKFTYDNGYFITIASNTVYYSVDGHNWDGINVYIYPPSGSIGLYPFDICHMEDDKYLVLYSRSVGVVSFKTKEFDNLGLNVLATTNDPLMTCSYANGMIVLLRSGTAGNTTTYYYGTDIHDLKETDPITDVVYSTKPEAMRAAYGNGMILAVTAGSSNIVYTTPSGPLTDN